jgi:hypothetical protein
MMATDIFILPDLLKTCRLEELVADLDFLIAGPFAQCSVCKLVQIPTLHRISNNETTPKFSVNRERDNFW